MTSPRYHWRIQSSFAPSKLIATHATTQPPDVCPSPGQDPITRDKRLSLLVRVLAGLAMPLRRGFLDHNTLQRPLPSCPF
ncbi:uncharacterized protein YALI1_A03507g [Yarrowia lipolytica]|uniref:Uncharacterized protein n=1 Tax=Yarrowia lipolytica TaxID=4952 RepID=A0A1D8N3L1_YARLL|nr:hypothetical protein YALI1_A03507g [Yarrowia lipolytica]